MGRRQASPGTPIPRMPTPFLALHKSIEQHINEETCTLLNQPNGRGVFEPHTLEAKGRRHKGKWSTVRSIETLESSIIRSCSVCMILPSSCTTISQLGPGYYKALPSHILYYFKVH